MANGQEGFVLNGTINPSLASIARMILRYESGEGIRVADTVVVSNQTFVIKGKLVQPSFVELVLIPDTSSPESRLRKPVTYSFAMDNAVMQVSLNGNYKFQVEGSPTRSTQLQYIAAVVSKGMKYDKLSLIDSFVRANPDSHFSLLLLESYISGASRIPQYKELFYLLPISLRQTKKGQAIDVKLSRLSELVAGNPAPEFRLPDAKGKQHSLSKMRGKYVFVEFWASYCRPCRDESKHVVKAFEDLKNLPVQFIGISFDKSEMRTAWLEAIKKDGLKGLQLVDKEGADGKAAKAFEVRGIPDNFLIGPDGLILARDIRGEQLGEKIKSYIK